MEKKTIPNLPIKTRFCYYDVLDRELGRLHDLVRLPQANENTVLSAMIQLSQLHRAFYRNNLSDYGFNEKELREKAPLIQIRGESVK